MYINIDLIRDLMNKQFLSKMEVKIFHSAYGNNQFTQLPFKLKQTSFYEAMNTYYRKFLMEELGPVSDMPFSKEENADLAAMMIIVRHMLHTLSIIFNA